MEGFSVLIRQAERKKPLAGAYICRGGPRLSDLLFANNSFLFCQAKREECSFLMEHLTLYKHSSSPNKNRDKIVISLVKILIKEENKAKIQ